MSETRQFHKRPRVYQATQWNDPDDMRGVVDDDGWCQSMGVRMHRGDWLVETKHGYVVMSDADFNAAFEEVKNVAQ